MTQNGRFSREIDSSLVSDLRKEPLFKSCLLPDIRSGKWQSRVFPAIRKGRIDFYYAGGKLFSYSATTGFTTHHKYASLFADTGKTYVSEANLRSAVPVQSFLEGYDRIKDNCSLYAGVEAQGLANLHRRSSFAVCTDEVVVLDIEVALQGQDQVWTEAADKQSRGKSSRMDLLLYNTRKGLLRFYEGKHYSNTELWAEIGRKPKVVKQLRCYNDILAQKERRVCILNAYASYLSTMNELFGLQLPFPKEVEESVVLFVFGFDSNQECRIGELLLSDGSLDGFRFRKRGRTTDSEYTASVLWSDVKQY